MSMGNHCLPKPRRGHTFSILFRWPRSLSYTSWYFMRSFLVGLTVWLHASLMQEADIVSSATCQTFPFISRVSFLSIDGNHSKLQHCAQYAMSHWLRCTIVLPWIALQIRTRVQQTVEAATEDQTSWILYINWNWRILAVRTSIL